MKQKLRVIRSIQMDSWRIPGGEVDFLPIRLDPIIRAETSIGDQVLSYYVS